MAQVIDGILYSPVNAHALRKGDQVHLVWCVCRLTHNTTRTAEFVSADVEVIAFTFGHMGENTTWLKFWPNEPILRAVGAGVGGVA